MTKTNSRIIKHIRKIFLQTERTKNANFNLNPFKNTSFQNVYIETRDFVKIGLWVLRASKPKGCFIFLHGNASNRVNFTKNFKMDRFVTSGYTIIVPDYREFGDSEGKFEVETVNYDIEAVYNYCLTHVDENPVIIGFSLGGAIALEYCKISHYKNKVILISTFSSSRDILNDYWLYRTANYMMPHIEKELIATFNYESTENIGTLNSDQVFILHGEKDNIVLIRHSKQFIEKLNCKYHFFKEDDHISIMKNANLLGVIEEYLNLK